MEPYTMPLSVKDYADKVMESFKDITEDEYVCWNDPTLIDDLKEHLDSILKNFNS